MRAREARGLPARHVSPLRAKRPPMFSQSIGLDMPHRERPERREPTGFYSAPGIDSLVRVVAKDAHGALVFDGQMTRALYEAARRHSVFEVWEMALAEVCCVQAERQLATPTAPASDHGARAD